LGFFRQVIYLFISLLSLTGVRLNEVQSDEQRTYKTEDTKKEKHTSKEEYDTTVSLCVELFM
jgi:hypothetical protein